MRRSARRRRREEYVDAFHDIDKSTSCLPGETTRVVIGCGRNRRRLVEVLAQDRAEAVAVAIDLVGEGPIGFVILDRAVSLRGCFEDGRQLHLRDFCAGSLGGVGGARDSVLGFEISASHRLFLTQLPTRLPVEEKTDIVLLNSVLIEMDATTGRACSIERLDREHTLAS